MAPVEPNWYRYLVSLAHELSLQSNRVRDLIGNSHWLSDGHHKEYLLLSVLNRHLPAGMVASRGFVISPTDPEARSKEQDILVVDTTNEAPIFRQGGLLVSFPRNVRAAISVKSTMKPETVDDSAAGLKSVRHVATPQDDHSIWCGAYFFVPSDAIANSPSAAVDTVHSAIREYDLAGSGSGVERKANGIQLFATANDIAIQIQGRQPIDGGDQYESVMTGYQANGLATSVFLADLLEHLSSTRGGHDIEFSLFAEQASLELIRDPVVLR